MTTFAAVGGSDQYECTIWDKVFEQKVEIPVSDACWYPSTNNHISESLMPVGWKQYKTRKEKAGGVVIVAIHLPRKNLSII